MNKKADFLVIGSGIAGLSFAIKASEYGNVIVLSKDVLEATATDKAQGGIAAVMYSPDTYEKHIADTINAGDKLSDPEVVAMTIKESTARVKELIEWGTNFDKNIDGSYNLGREGGHTEKRILHYKDSTGSEIQRALIDKVKKSENIELLENHFAIDLITQHHLGEKITRNSKNTECFGVYALDIKSQNIYTILSKICMIATGGTGMAYKTTTNPETATGDGIAMVKLAIWSLYSFTQLHYIIQVKILLF
jgi:L-aspartate oxidase